MKTDHVVWPFFEARHRALAGELGAWASRHLQTRDHGTDVDAQCRALVRALGQAGWLRHAVAGTAYGGASEVIDTRAICLLRETLAWHQGLADFAFSMQGLGSGAISLAGSLQQRERYMPHVAEGRALAAFALSEPGAGSDAAAEGREGRPCRASAHPSRRACGRHSVARRSRRRVSDGSIRSPDQ